MMSFFATSAVRGVHSVSHFAFLLGMTSLDIILNLKYYLDTIESENQETISEIMCQQMLSLAQHPMRSFGV